MNMVMLILNTVFNFQYGSHGSCSHTCFLPIFANSSLRHKLALGPVLRSFCPVLTFQRFENEMCKAVLQRQPQLHFSGLFFLIIIILNILFIYFEREGKGGRKGEKHQCVVVYWRPNLTRNPGMCPDWELNW